MQFLHDLDVWPTVTFYPCDQQKPFGSQGVFWRFDEGKIVAAAACGGRWGQECITADAPDVRIGGSEFSGKACDSFDEGTDGVSIRCGCRH